MKALAQSYVWWPGIDKDIESCVQSCSVCQVNCNMPVAVPLHPWEFPQEPWSLIHLDYAGPCEGKMLIILNAYTKWLDVHPKNTSTLKATIEKLHRLFAEHGFSDQCVIDNVIDNGTCFISADFKEFMTNNGINNITSSSYHPATNGQAERAVQSVKESLKKTQDGDIETGIC